MKIVVFLIIYSRQEATQRAHALLSNCTDSAKPLCFCTAGKRKKKKTEEKKSKKIMTKEKTDIQKEKKTDILKEKKQTEKLRAES